MHYLLGKETAAYTVVNQIDITESKHCSTVNNHYRYQGNMSSLLFRAGRVKDGVGGGGKEGDFYKFCLSFKF